MVGGVREDKTFFFESVTELGAMGWEAVVEDSSSCCGKCRDKYPESGMFEFERYGKYCTCFKTVRDKQPLIFARGTYAGICAN